MHRTAAWLLAATAFCVVPASAQEDATSAQEAAPNDDRARLHFRAGESHYAAGRFDRAAQEFEASYALRPHPELQHNIYLAHRDAGNRAAAAAALRQYLDDAASVPNRELLEARLAALERGDEEPTPGEEASESGESPSLVPGVVLLGVGVVAGVVSVVTGTRALDAEDRLHTRCPTRTGCSSEDRAIEDEARRFGIATDVLWPAAAALATVGLILVIRAALSSDTDVQVGCTGSGCAAALRGTF